MVPDHSFFEALVACVIEIAPKDYYKRLDEGIIVLKRSKTFSFCNQGLVVEGGSSVVKSDVVIFATGFKGNEKIKGIFMSEYNQSIAIGSASTIVPLYRSVQYIYYCCTRSELPKS